MERNPGQNRKEQECIKSMFEDNKINQKLIVREKEMEERINEKHLKKRKHEEADQAGSKKQNRERAEQKLQSRELRSTRRRQMQENEKETLTYTRLGSGRPRGKGMAELSRRSRYRDAPD